MMLEWYVMEQREWSARTFGPGRRVMGLTRHIEKEIEEIRRAPEDLSEWIDVVILALDGAWRAGYSPAAIAAELERKQKENFARKWPAAVSEDEPTEHVRE